MTNLATESVTTSKRRAPDLSSTTCQKCGADDTSSFEMIYTSGTSTGIFTAGSYTMGVGASITKGQTTNQSVLASRARPPLKPTMRFGLMVVAFVLTFIVSMILFEFLPAMSGEVKFLLFLGVIAGLMVGVYVLERKRLQPLTEQYAKDFAAWQRSWICLRCGNTWRRIRTA
jgi:hypothetical protein